MSEKPSNPKDAVGTNKPNLGLCPDTLPAAAAAAFFEGAMKYGRYNWRGVGVRASIYHDALRRHLGAWWNGENIDPESGLPHLWKVAACIAILIDAEAAGKLTDDRPPSTDLPGMFRAIEPLMAALREKHKDKNPHQWTIKDPIEGDSN